MDLLQLVFHGFLRNVLDGGRPFGGGRIGVRFRSSEGRQIWTDTVLAVRPPGVCTPDEESLRPKKKGRHGRPFAEAIAAYLKGAAIAFPKNVPPPSVDEAWKTKSDPSLTSFTRLIVTSYSPGASVTTVVLPITLA